MERKSQRHLNRVPALAGAIAILAALVMGACQRGPDAGLGPFSGEGKPRVFTDNYPLAWMAGRLAGDLAEVVFPAPPDSDPAFWKPGEEDIAAYQSADLILLNGAGYAKWAERASLPPSILVDTSGAFAGQFIVTASSVTHSHGADGEHAHDGVAFTTWLDFQQALQQASAVHDALASLLPGSQDILAENFAALSGDLEALDATMAETASAFAGVPLAASHPVYQYLARRYALKIDSLHWEPEEVPDEEAMADLAELLARHPAKLMIWEGEPEEESVAKLAALGVKSVVFDPCGNRPDDGRDFLEVMRENIARLAAAAP